MDWHPILETTFGVMFLVGLVLTVVMAVMSGAFHSEIGAGSSFEGGVAHDLGGADIGSGVSHADHPEVGWSHGELPGISPWSPTVICAALTGAGGLGWLALKTWSLGVGASLVVALVGALVLGGLTFAVLVWMFRYMQSTSLVTASSMVGCKALVDTAIEAQSAGAIAFEAAGSRMVAPARGVDAAAIPAGAEVEIVSVDGTVYQVKETRESWLARSKGAAH
jgi:membrane protein implicated in regulation of membrane protease activity